MDENLMYNIINYNKSRLKAFKNNEQFDFNKEYEKKLCARYMKISRIKRRLVDLIIHKDYIWFCTFTFDDYYINKSDRTKRDLIKNSLKNFDFKYILNVDYGSKTEREHYHCILATNYSFDIDKHLKEHYPCFSSAKLCNKSLEDTTRLTKYINKLSNHCLKESTKNKRIYCNFKSLDQTPLDSYTKRIIYLKWLAVLDKANTTGKVEK